MSLASPLAPEDSPTQTRCPEPMATGASAISAPATSARVLMNSYVFSIEPANDGGRFFPPDRSVTGTPPTNPHPPSQETPCSSAPHCSCATGCSSKKTSTI